MEVTQQDSGQAAAPEAAPEGGGGGGFDPSVLAPLQEHIERLGQTVDQRLGGLEQRLPAQQQQADPYGQDPYGQPDPGQQFGQQPGMVPGMPGQPQGPLVDEYGDPTPEGYQAMLQQAVAPLQQQFARESAELRQQVEQQQEMLREFQMDRGAEQLESKFPELADQQKAEALVESAAQYGRPDLVGEAWFLELVHKAQRAEAAAGNETPATPAPPLEPAGGASLAAGELTPQERIKNAGSKSSIWG